MLTRSSAFTLCTLLALTGSFLRALPAQPTVATGETAAAAANAPAAGTAAPAGAVPAGAEPAATERAADAGQSTSATTPVASPRKPGTEQEDRDAAALQFLKDHHPELAALLESTRHRNRKAYHNALRDVDQARVRLERMRTRMPDRYEEQLQEWRATSEVRLRATRAAMSDDEATAESLKEALRERNRIRLGAQQSERARLQRRLERLDAAIKRQTDSPEETLEREFTNVMRDARRVVRNTPRPVRNQPRTTPQTSNARQKAPTPAVAAEDPVTPDRSPVSLPSEK